MRRLVAVVCILGTGACGADGQSAEGVAEPGERLAQLAEDTSRDVCPISGADDAVLAATEAELTGVIVSGGDGRYAVTCDWGDPQGGGSPQLSLLMDGIGNRLPYDDHEVLEAQTLRNVQVEVSAREDSADDFGRVAQELVGLTEEELARRD